MNKSKAELLKEYIADSGLSAAEYIQVFPLSEKVNVPPQSENIYNSKIETRVLIENIHKTQKNIIIGIVGLWLQGYEPMHRDIEVDEMELNATDSDFLIDLTLIDRFKMQVIDKKIVVEYCTQEIDMDTLSV